MRDDLDRVRLAAELGVLTGQAEQQVAAGDALLLLCDAIHPDAAELLAWDPFVNEHVSVASARYDAEVAHYLRFGMMADDFYGVLRSAPGPLSIDGEDCPIDFRTTSHYSEVLEPAGYQDGMSAPLVAADGRYTGMLHMSTAAACQFTAVDRSWLGAVSSVLANLVDVTRSSPLERLPAGCDVALVSRTGMRVPLPGRRTPDEAVLTALQPFVGRFLDARAPSIQFLVEVTARWHQVRLTVALSPHGATPCVLVAVARCELPYQLTPREIDVLTRMAIGESNQKIAGELFVSIRTVTTHVERILHKLGVASRAGAAGRAVREGLVRPTLSSEPDSVVTSLLDAARSGPLATTWHL